MGRGFFVLLFFIYALLYIAKHTGIYLGWVSFYAADLLCLPITLPIVRFIMLKTNVIWDEFEFTPAMILMAALSFGIIFEWFLPKQSENYQSDLFDFVAYILGGIAYFIFRKLYREKQTA
jgi:hypothetical protein